MMRVLFFLFVLASPVFAIIYTIEDLIALEQKKRYREFLLHAHDIRPSQRDNAWQKMIEHMGTGFVNKLISEKNYEMASFNFVQRITLWDELKEDAYFHSKRDIYAIKYLQYCLEHRPFDSCHTQAKQSWNVGIKNRDTGVLIAELLTKRSQETDVFYFVQEAIHSNFGEFYCKKSFLQKALYERLYRRVIGKEGITVVGTLVDQIIGQGCFSIFAQLLIKELESPQKPSRDFAYKVLSAKKRLSTEGEDFYLVRFLLDSPKKGRIFNLAWAKLKEIAEDHKRRGRLVQKLESLDPLPDAVFASSDQLKKKTMARYFYQTIPEYMNHYIKTCLAYLGGTGHFPNGNPTVHCDGFFQATAQNALPEQEVRMRYSGLKKFIDDNRQQDGQSRRENL